MTDAQPSAALLRAIADDRLDQLLRAIADEPQRAAPDRLDQLRDECRRVRDDDAELADLVARIEEIKSRRTMRLRETIPDLMDQCGVPSISLAAEGNLPAVEIAIRPHYSANIAAPLGPKNKKGWPEEKRQAAFAWLDQNGAGDLIKTTVEIFFPRDRRASAVKFVDDLKVQGLDVEVSEAVASQTLTKWLGETHRAGGALPPLDLIGGFVGRIAAIVPADKRR